MNGEYDLGFYAIILPMGLLVWWLVLFCVFMSIQEIMKYFKKKHE